VIARFTEFSQEQRQQTDPDQGGLGDQVRVRPAERAELGRFSAGPAVWLNDNVVAISGDTKRTMNYEPSGRRISPT
jgi:hypothetical protein